MINSSYEMFTPYPVIILILKSDCLPIIDFDMGKPIRTIGGLNGFLTSISYDGLSGTLDIKAGQVYRSLVTWDSSTGEAEGIPVYVDSVTGELVTTELNNYLFGKIILSGDQDPTSVPGSEVLGVMLLN